MKCSPLCCSLLLFFVSYGYSQDANTTAAPTTAAPTTAAPTTAAHAKAEKMKSHISMTCTADYMEAKIDRKQLQNLDISQLHLVDEKCKSTEVTDDFITFRTPLDGCGTTHNISSDGDYLVYYNAISGDLVAPTTHSLITREHTAEMPFQCSYDRKVVISRQAFTPRRAVVYTKTESFGNFTFTMDMYETENYKEKHEYPADIPIGSPMHLEVTVETNTSALAVVPVMCHATPTKGYSDKPQYVFINNSCGQDDTLKYNFKEHSVQRFSLDAFRFLPDYDEVYLHCKVVACPKGESDSRCAVGCKSDHKSSSTRRRRAVTLVRDIEQKMAVGPIKLRQKTFIKGPTRPRTIVSWISKFAQSASQSSASSMITMITIVAGVLGFLVLALAVAIVVVFKRRESLTKGSTLLVQDEA